VELSNRFAALENLCESSDLNTGKSIRENLRYYRVKHSKPWFDDECSKLIDQQKQAELQWL
jgi:hypothetical protein